MTLARSVPVLLVASMLGCGGDDGGGGPAADRDGASSPARDGAARDAIAADGPELPPDMGPELDAATDPPDAIVDRDASPPDGDATIPPVDASPAPDADAAPPPPSCATDRDCSDGVLCNGPERCDPMRGCVAADPAAICEDRDPCTALSSCDAATDTCSYACNRFEPACAREPICLSDCVIDDDCNDGFFCSGRERCVDGTCRHGTPETCDDGDPCTVEIGCLRTADECVRECNTRNPSCDCGDAG